MEYRIMRKTENTRSWLNTAEKIFGSLKEILKNPVTPEEERRACEQAELEAEVDLLFREML